MKNLIFYIIAIVFCFSACKKEKIEPVKTEYYTSTIEFIGVDGKYLWISRKPVYYQTAPGEIWYFIYTYKK